MAHSICPMLRSHYPHIVAVPKAWEHHPDEGYKTRTYENEMCDGVVKTKESDGGS